VNTAGTEMNGCWEMGFFLSTHSFYVTFHLDVLQILNSSVTLTDESALKLLAMLTLRV